MQHPPIHSFVHHRSRLTEGQQHAWERWWHTRGRDVEDLLSGAEPFDPPAWFGRTAPLVLEIGSGMGESTAALAAAAPDVDHLAVEVFEPGLAQLLMRLAEADLTNVALLRGDAVALLRQCVPPASLSRDPDLLPGSVAEAQAPQAPARAAGLRCAGGLAARAGGTLHMATDWDDYAVQMRQVCDAEPLLENTAAGEPDGWTPRPEWRPVTKFEQRAVHEGRAVHDLVYRRVSTEPPSDLRTGA